jgi:L-2,4-diaminobutyrate transaminase
MDTLPRHETRRDELEALDRAHLFHPSTHLAAHARGDTPHRMMTGGSGVYVVDSEGRRHLDAFAGLYCVNIGYGRTDIADAISAQAHALAYYHAYAGHAAEPTIRLAAKIVEKAPPGMSRVFFGLTGSDANETIVKLVWYCQNVLGRPEKKKIVGRRRGYHGSGLVTGSLTGLGLFQDHFDLPLQVARHTHCPHHWKHAPAGMDERAYSAWLAQELDDLIVAEGPETVAAFIAEPVLGTGGIIPPPEGYWEAVQPVLRKHDVMLVCDEVITGFGRLGRWFGSELYGIEPDFMTIAKGLTSAYLPLSGVVVSERIWNILEDGTDRFGPLGHGWTYAAHPTCAAAGLANVEAMDREGIVDHAARVAPYFQRRLREAFADHPMVGEVRGVGLMACLEFARDKDPAKPFDPSLKLGPAVAAACFEEGLIARGMPMGDMLGFCPPLVITEDEIERVVEMTARALDRVWATVPR